MRPNLTQCIVNVFLFHRIRLYQFFRQQTRRPENKAFCLFVAHPAMLLLPSHYLPLARARNLILMVQIAHEDQFGLNVEVCVVCGTVLHDSFRVVDLFNLDRLPQELSVERSQCFLVQYSLKVELLMCIKFGFGLE